MSLQVLYNKFYLCQDPIF